VLVLLLLQSVGWRTMLVVPQLENDLAVSSHCNSTHYEFCMLRTASDMLSHPPNHTEMHVGSALIPLDPSVSVLSLLLLLLLLSQSLGWRTMLVVPELENELAVSSHSNSTHYELRMLRTARADVDSQLQRLEWAVARGEVAPEAMAQNQAQLGLLHAEREAIKERYSRLLK
jgi:hypothetical protein